MKANFAFSCCCGLNFCPLRGSRRQVGMWTRVKPALMEIARA